MQSEQNNSETEKVYLTNPLWYFIFFLLGFIILILIGIPVLFLTGLSSSDDRVFAVEALIAGLLSEFVINKWLHKELYLFPKINFPFYYFWVSLSIYVFVFQPFE